MCLNIILKVTKNQGFRRCIFRETTREDQIDPLPPSRFSVKNNKRVKKWLPSNMTGGNFCRGKVTKCFPGDE